MKTFIHIYIRGKRFYVCDLKSRMEKRMKLDDDGVIDTVKLKMKETDDKMKKLSSAWDQQTQGLHLDSSGQLVGKDSCLFSCICIIPLAN